MTPAPTAARALQSRKRPNGRFSFALTISARAFRRACQVAASRAAYTILECAFARVRLQQPRRSAAENVTLYRPASGNETCAGRPVPEPMQRSGIARETLAIGAGLNAAVAVANLSSAPAAPGRRPRMKRYAAIAQMVANSIRYGDFSHVARVATEPSACGARRVNPATARRGFYMCESEPPTAACARRGQLVPNHHATRMHCDPAPHRRVANRARRRRDIPVDRPVQARHTRLSHRWPWPPAVEDAIRTLGTLADRQRQTR